MSRIHSECVGESRAVLETIDKLKRIELRMEGLTQKLEMLPNEKVKIAQKVSTTTSYAHVCTRFCYYYIHDAAAAWA